ncbi:MmgE/PrpD family protein [Methylobacterium pseudosasicola]|uniref:2-methylcitrate dehydratase PrpD n=1 Tax=Methylobacterium pseudosasicola TaxID=582667 RepID=A0A1I4R6D6_9HYPH|nr:MmgE/PrpD family protein [Methylobacterium pseudosasicola]SFM47483.1 2-methylcitrate dehydratase PrpD [Methylobacterium pseudosasicola]
MPNRRTAALAEAIAASRPDKDPAAMRAARIALVDFLACALAGSTDPSLAIVRGVFGNAPGRALVIGSAQPADPFLAALLNGHAGHVLDYDDVHASVRGHPTTVIVPALLAALDSDALPTADAFLAAYLVGLETMAHLGRAIGPAHYERGFHATATLGPLGAAAAIAHMRGFSARTTAIALGLGATQAAGLRLQFGSDAKPLHAGLAARNGLVAARLAEAGLSGADDCLDGENGFLQAYGFGEAAPERVLEGWAAPWQIVRPGLTLKAFPCCTAAHPVAVAGLAFHREGIRDLARATITFPPGGDAALVVRTPRTGIEARFSPEYILAAALVDGAVRIDHFDERPVRPDLAALAVRVERRHDQAARRLSSDPSTRFVVVELTDGQGRTHERRIDGLPGLAVADDKFRDATAGSEALRPVPDLVRTMHDAMDLARLLACLAQPRQP